MIIQSQRDVTTAVLAELQRADNPRFREIMSVGGSREAPGEAYVGGLWVLEVATRERAVALIEGNPYYESTLRSYKLRTWGKALADKSALL